MHRHERWVFAVLLAYATGFFLFPPRVLLIIDEFNYVAQAMAFSQGALTIPGAEPLYPPNPLRVASNYPPGTSLLQAPFVALAGWRAAAVLSVFALVIATWVTMKWLSENDRDPAFAALLPAFFGALFFGRVAMSDVPSAAMVALSLWLVWRAERGLPWSFTAGLITGLNLLFREPSVLLLGPVFISAIVRRKCVPWALILGVVVGILARLSLSEALFGSALYVRDSGYGFSIGSVARNLPQYAPILLLMFPLGGLVPFLYRGPRRAELVLGLALYIGTFLFYDYGGVDENGGVRGLVLASRFMVPALPVLAFMAADVYPRLLGRMPESVGNGLLRLRPIALALIALMAFGIHPLLRHMEQAPLSVVTAIQRAAPEGVPVVTNHHATLKYLSPVYGAHRLILRAYITAADVPRFYRSAGGLAVVLLDRDDSDMFREDAKQNNAFLAQLQQRCSLVVAHDAPHGSGTRLRVLNVTGCS